MVVSDMEWSDMELVKEQDIMDQMHVQSAADWLGLWNKQHNIPVRVLSSGWDS